jgi:phosphate-selective porin OprO/OprP
MTREEQLEARVRQLEAMVNSLSGQMQTMAVGGPVAGTAAPDIGTPAEVIAPSASGGPGAPGQSLPPNPAPDKRFNSPAIYENKSANVKFGPGFEIRTDDDEYIFQFHNLTQFDYRGYLQGSQNPVHDGFVFPRQWWMFTGRLSKPFGYFLSFANGFDTFSLLDVFGDVDVDPRFRLRIGRFKTPFTYEFLVEPVQGLINPERSLFFNNFGQNRDDGIMAFGRLFDNKMDYATGIFNGSRNGVVPSRDAKYVSGLINFQPFNNCTDSLLEHFNVGGSVFAGHASNLPTPVVYRTIVPMTGNSVAGVPFLALDPSVRSQGFEAYWDLHVAWFYRQLAVIGEWGSGAGQFATTKNLNDRARIPVESFYVQAGYLLTGETRSSVGIVKPNHPFNFCQGQFGLGAWELTGRYDYMDISSQIFTDKFADPHLWANRLWMTDLGMNWHLTQYLKMYFDWNHAEFNQPVLFTTTPTDRKQLTSDMFWVRFQIYF